jgi:tRNA(Ile)-lysidine synthase
MNARVVETTSERVWQRIRSAGLLRSGQRVLVACSGGADSTAMLDLLRRLAPRGGWTPVVVTIDHHQQPRHTAAVRQLRNRCRRWSLQFVASALAPEQAAPGSDEDRLRRARYRLLRRVAADQGCQRVATGHTADDQVETVLLRLLRGTGVRGLGGIPAMRDGLFIRPLLDLGRSEVKAYLRARRLSWCDDPTNRDRRRPRNRIRHRLLPRLRREYNPRLDQALLRLAAAAGRDEAALSGWAARVALFERGDGAIAAALDDVRALPEAVQVRLIQRMLQRTAGGAVNLEQKHVERLLQRLATGAPGRLELQAGLAAVMELDALVIHAGRPAAPAPFALRIDGPGRWPLPAGSGQLQLRRVRRFRPERAGPRLAYFDAERAGLPLTVRSPRPGDRLRPWGMAGSKKVARLLLDAKIPARRRPAVPLLVGAAGVLWVIGLRRSREAAVGPETDGILEVEYLDGAGGEP